MLRELGAEVREVRVPADLDGPRRARDPRRGVDDDDARDRARGARRAAARAGPLRHAGARHLRGDDHARPRAPRAGRLHCRRNAFGRQIRSFEADLEIPGIDGEPVRAVFIRAPWIDEHGDGVEVLAEVDGHVVAARQDNMLVISFHPEIAGETRIHELFLEGVAA